MASRRRHILVVEDHAETGEQIADSVRCWHHLADRTIDAEGREQCGKCGDRLIRPEPASAAHIDRSGADQ